MKDIPAVVSQLIKKPKRKVIIKRGIHAEYLRFQGEPFQEKDYQEAILAVQDVMNEYDPSIKGYEWDDEHPRIQLEPIGERGYIELRAVKKICAFK